MTVSTSVLGRLGSKRTGTYCVTWPLYGFLKIFSDKIQISSGMSDSHYIMQANLLLQTLKLVTHTPSSGAKEFCRLENPYIQSLAL